MNAAALLKDPLNVTIDVPPDVGAVVLSFRPAGTPPPGGGEAAGNAEYDSWGAGVREYESWGRA